MNLDEITSRLDYIFPTVVRYAGIVLAFLEFFLDGSAHPETYMASVSMFLYKSIKNGGKHNNHGKSEAE